MRPLSLLLLFWSPVLASRQAAHPTRVALSLHSQLSALPLNGTSQQLGDALLRMPAPAGIDQRVADGFLMRTVANPAEGAMIAERLESSEIEGHPGLGRNLGAGLRSLAGRVQADPALAERLNRVLNPLARIQALGESDSLQDSLDSLYVNSAGGGASVVVTPGAPSSRAPMPAAWQLQAASKERAAKEQAATPPRPARDPKADAKVFTEQVTSTLGGIGSMGLAMGLAVRGVDGFEALFERYDARHDVYVIPDDAMTVVGKAFGMENAEAANFMGRFIFMKASSMEKLEKGDPVKRLALSHERRHMDYAALHPAPDKPQVERRLADELHAFFASFVEVYGAPAAAKPWNAEPSYNQAVFSLLQRHYMNELQGPPRDEMIARLGDAVGIIGKLLDKGDVQRVLDRLKASTTLDQITALDPSTLTGYRVQRLSAQKKWREALAAIDQFRRDHPAAFALERERITGAETRIKAALAAQ